MLNSTECRGPSLSEVLAFCLLEPEDDVARVASLARHRLRRPWTAWRVSVAELEEEADDLFRFKIYADDVYRDSFTGFFEFFCGQDGNRQSPRFAAFLRSCGIARTLEDIDDLEGRYFSTRNGGKVASDFAALSATLR